jgi:hypothetical protein
VAEIPSGAAEYDFVKLKDEFVPKLVRNPA